MNIDHHGSTEFLNFSDALHHLRWGEKIARRVWTDGKCVEVRYDEEETHLYISGGYRLDRMKLAGFEVLAEDWFVLCKGN